MTGVVLLLIRVLLVVVLYGFLFWALVTIWRDLRQKKAAIQNQKPVEIRMQITSGDDIQKKIFQESEVTLGRDPANECVLPSETVSARHARFTHHHGQWWLEDLKSTNGTLINGEILTTAVVVIPGDRITCGDVEIMLLEE